MKAILRLMSLGLILKRLRLGDIMICNFVLLLGSLNYFRESDSMKERTGWRQKENKKLALTQVLFKFSSKPPMLSLNMRNITSGNLAFYLEQPFSFFVLLCLIAS